MKNGILVTCPICASDMHVTSLTCPACKAELRGDFIPDPLTKLNETQRQFVVAFLQVGGNLKEMERILGISYPTVRARIAEIIAAMGVAPSGQGPTRREVLEQLAKGEIEPQEASRRLAELS